MTPRLTTKSPTTTVPMPRYPNGPNGNSSIAASNGIDNNESSMTGPCRFGSRNDLDRIRAGDGDDLHQCVGRKSVVFGFGFVFHRAVLHRHGDLAFAGPMAGNRQVYHGREADDV